MLYDLVVFVNMDSMFDMKIYISLHFFYMFSSIDHLGLGYYNLNYSNSVGPVMIMINMYVLLICISEVFIGIHYSTEVS